MGRAVVEELQRGGRRIVVVERDPDRVHRLQEAGIPAVEGDATSEATLRAARIDTAHGLVSCVNDDAHNVYTVLTARTLNPRLFIVARATEEQAEDRIRQAGADRVVNPYQLGGTRLAHLLAKPAIVNFFDASLGRGEELQLDQVSISPGSVFSGKTLLEANLRKQWGIGVVAVQRNTQVIANPPPDLAVQGGDVLVVFGSLAQIQAFERAST
jgi:voltage-gated potassium channel